MCYNNIVRSGPRLAFVPPGAFLLSRFLAAVAKAAVRWRGPALSRGRERFWMKEKTNGLRAQRMRPGGAGRTRTGDSWGRMNPPLLPSELPRRVFIQKLILHHFHQRMNHIFPFRGIFVDAHVRLHLFADRADAV